ncbi:MAG: class I SAM-dependent methyltransferase [Pseudomonadota bacterium]
MKNTSNMFNKIFTQNESEIWDKFLKFQSEIFVKEEIELLKKFGFSEKLSPVLDLGCGTGHFSFDLNKHFNNMSFVCADVNETFLSILDKRLINDKLDNIKTIKYSAGHEKVPALINKCKTVIMRMFLQHTLDPLKVLSDLRHELKQGTDIFIIEDDLSFYDIDPPLKAFNRFVEIVDEYCTGFASNVYIGKSIPRLANKAGLKVINTEMLIHNNIKYGSDRLMDFFRLSLMLLAKTSSVVDEEEALKLIEKFDEFVIKNKEACFFFHAFVVTHARV